MFQLDVAERLSVCDKCKFVHLQADEESMRGRCFFCSAADHWANSSPIKAARRAESKGMPDETAKGKAKALQEDPGSLQASSLPGSSSLPAPMPLAPSAAPQPSPQVAQVAIPEAASLQASVTQDLVREMAEVLRSLKLKSLRSPWMSTTDPLSGCLGQRAVLDSADVSRGLIDSGATAPLRQGSEDRSCESEGGSAAGSW